MTGIVAISGRGRQATAALSCALLAAACQTPLEPVVPAGQAGYAAIAVPEGAALPDRYPLAPGDVIAVRVYGEEELTVEETALDAAGNVSLPLIGDVRAAGLSATELARSIEAAYAAQYLRDPRVSVVIRKAQPQTVAVEGEVTQPGVYPYAPGQTLLSALALARSPTDTAKLDEIIVFRTVNGQRSAGRFDLQAIRGGRMPDVAMLPGDVVVVGYSSLRGAYLDALKALPILGIFQPIR